jgi:tetraacyldisaccharide 4'-kinase
MRAPKFWDFGAGGAFLPALLGPFEAITAAVTARRVTRVGWRAPVPVICCGNASVGGAGKTTLALDLGRRLRARGANIAFLTRGHGGRGDKNPIGVRPARDSAKKVGDEALLLAAVAPTFVAADRAAAARAAIADGASILVMDDGLQNPTLEKTISLLVVDGEAWFGNGRLLPAGPLREPVAAAARRCAAAVLIGPDRTDSLARLPPSLPVLRASLRSAFDPGAFGGKKLVAFAGIGRPEKFFSSLEARGAELAAHKSFPDHHRYTQRDLAKLLDLAERIGAIAVTTPKDFTRLPLGSADRVRAVDVDLIWDDPGEIERLLDGILAR